jgi:hypothetical protein
MAIYLTELSSSSKETDKGNLSLAAFNLYGFAEQAAESGDKTTAERAREIAGRVISKEYFNDVIGRRVGPEGELVLQREDLVS